MYGVNGCPSFRANLLSSSSSFESPDFAEKKMKSEEKNTSPEHVKLSSNGIRGGGWRPGCRIWLYSLEISQTSASILIFPDNPKQEKVRKMMCNFFPRWSFEVPFSRAYSCLFFASLRSASLFFLYFFSSPPNFWMMFSPCFFTQETSLNRKFFFSFQNHSRKLQWM